MLKYFKKAYIMSVASYIETPGGGEVQTTQEEKNFQEQVNLAIADGKIEESEILNLQELYEAEKDNIKETFVEARRNELIQVIAQNLVLNNTKGEFENEFEVGADAIQIDTDILSGRLVDKDTFFNSEYAEIADRFGITSTEVLNAISTMAPERVELDTIGNIENDIVEGAEYVAEKTVEGAEYIADKTIEFNDRAIVATAEVLDPTAAKERLANRNKPETVKAALAQEGNEKSAKIPNKEYKVVSGDNLTKIAKKYNTTIDKIIEINPEIKNKNKIKIGQKIIIPTKKEEK